MTHGDYRRESFHCEHSLQSLLEIEGENGPAPPSPSSSSSPSPPLGGEITGLKPSRRMGRQESPLSRESILTTKEKDSQTVELIGPKISSTNANVEIKTGEKGASTTGVIKQRDVATTETKNNNVDKGITVSSPHSETIASKSNEKSDKQTDSSAKAKHQDPKQATDTGAKEKKQDSKQQNVITENTGKSKQPDGKQNTLIDHPTKGKQQAANTITESATKAKLDSKQHSLVEASSKGKVGNQQGAQDGKQQGTPTDSSAKAKQPDCKPQSTIGDNASKAKDKTEDKTKGTPAPDKANSQKYTEPNQKSRKGSETTEKAGSTDREKTTEAPKPRGQAPPASTQVQAGLTQAPVKAKSEKQSGPSSSYRTGKDERVHLEALDENPMSPSSCSPSPSSSKSRPMSPGDKTSFVTQLTSVAKTVLGPMKGGSQEGVKVKDGTKTSEDKRGNTTVKSETGGSGRRGQAAQSDKANSRSSKHH